MDGELFGWGVKMIFCDECFKDEQIKSIIVGATLNDHRSKGNCPICGKKNVFLYDTEKDSSLDGFFDELINIYNGISSQMILNQVIFTISSNPYQPDFILKLIIILVALLECLKNMTRNI